MSKLTKGNEEVVNKKIELMIKIIVRTDSYLNSANTKSTILLSLSSALLVAATINFSNISSLVFMGSDRFFVQALLVLILFFLIASIIFSLKGITPFIEPSQKGNAFSFVDIVKGYKDLNEYRREFSSVNDLEFLNQLIALNHNLSVALVSKYEKQITAITCIEAAAYVLCFSIYVMILSNC